MENLDRGENRGVVFRSTKIDERSRRDDYPLAGGLDDTRAQRGVQRTCVTRLLVKEASALRNNPLMEPRCLHSDNPRATLSQRVISILFYMFAFFSPRYSTSTGIPPRKKKFRLFEREGKDRGILGGIGSSFSFLLFLLLFFFWNEWNARLKYLRRSEMADKRVRRVM